MNISKFWGKVLGLYLIIVGLAMLLNMHHFEAYVAGLVHDEPLVFVTGFFTLILGLVLVVSHNIWEWNWRVIVTLIAWITLLKGASLIYYPQLIDKATNLFLQNPPFAYSTAIIDLILGVILIYFGFCRKVD